MMIAVLVNPEVFKPARPTLLARADEVIE